MIRLLEFLWHGCWHNWQFKNTRKVIYTDCEVSYPEAVYQCSKCGRIEARRI